MKGHRLICLQLVRKGGYLFSGGGGVVLVSPIFILSMPFLFYCRACLRHGAI